MVSLLPPQSDVTLPGPTRLEGEPQGDLMQAPGLPGSPAPQSVSTWYRGLGLRAARETGEQSPPPSRGLPGVCLSLPPTNKCPVTLRSRAFGYAYTFSLGLSQGRDL